MIGFSPGKSCVIANCSTNKWVYRNSLWHTDWGLSSVHVVWEHAGVTHMTLDSLLFQSFLFAGDSVCSFTWMFYVYPVTVTIIIYNLFLKMFIGALSACMSVYYLCTHGGQRECQIPGDWSYMVVSCLLWVLRVEPRYSWRSVSTFRCWAVSPVPSLSYIFK